MKKFAALLLAAAMLTALFGCASKYSPVKPDEQDLTVVATVGDYPVYYEELRFLTMYFKNTLTDMYGVDWSAPSDEFRDMLYSLVWGGLTYNYTVLMMFEQIYGDQYEAIEEDVQAEIAAEIDKYGSRKAYIAALEAGYMTDHFVRFQRKCDICEDELLNFYVGTESDGEIDNSTLAFFDFLYSESSDLIRVMHIRLDATAQGAESLADDLRGRLADGEDIFELARQYSIDYEEGDIYGDYMMPNDYYDSRYTEAAYATGEVGSVSPTVRIGDSLFIIQRLAKEQLFMTANYTRLTNQYLYYELEKIIRRHESSMTVTKTEYGEALDLTAMQ